MNDPDIVPPLQERLTVALRTLCLGAFVMRGLIEHLLGQMEDETARGRTVLRAIHISTWLREEGFERHCSPVERALLRQKPGTWGADALAVASWRTEALGMLMWALGQVEDMPPYDGLFTPDVVFERLPVPGYPEDFLAGTRLRPESALREARDVAELWHWRGRMAAAQRDGLLLPTTGDEYEASIRRVAAGAHEAGAIAAPQEGDFVLSGQPYRELAPDQQRRALAMASERHFALNWLCGYAAPDGWDDTPTDT